MRIAYVIDDIHRTGGAQRATVRLVEQAVSLPHSVDILALDDGTGGPYRERIAAAGVSVHAFPASSLLSVRRLWRLVRALRVGEYDLVHTNLAYANIVGVIAARLAGIPVVAGFRTVYTHQRRGDAVRHAIERLVIRRFARAAMAVGPATAASHQHRFTDLEIVPLANAVEMVEPDVELRGRARTDLGLRPSDTAVAAVSSLRAVKAVGLLIEAVAAIPAGKRPVVLIAGTGPLRDELEQLATELGVDSRVNFLGQVDPVAPVLAAADIFVNTSEREGLSNAILEAMAVGLPVIATDVGDSAYALGETGVVVPSGDVGAVTDALIELLDNAGRRGRLGAAARDRVRSHHDPKQWADDVFDFYARWVR